MTKLVEQDSDFGLSNENSAKPSSQGSKVIEIENSDSKALGEETSPKSPIQSPKSKKKITKLSESEPGNTSEIIPKKERKPKSLMPVPKVLDKRSTAALRRLKIKDRDLASAPPITSLIKSTVKGGLKVALEAMRFGSDDTDIRAFLRVYDKTPSGDRDSLSWEAISIAAKVNPKHLLGAIQLAVQNYCWNRSRFIAVSNHPDLMDARIKFGKMSGGERDRTQVDIALGFLPSPKGPTFIGKQVAVFGAGNGNNSDKNDGAIEGTTTAVDIPSTDVEDRLFGDDDLDIKLGKIRQRLLEG